MYLQVDLKQKFIYMFLKSNDTHKDLENQPTATKKNDLTEQFRSRHVQISEHLQSKPIKNPEFKNPNCDK